MKAYYHSKRKHISENFQRHQGTIVGEQVHTVKETIQIKERHEDLYRETHTDPNVYTHTHRFTCIHTEKPMHVHIDLHVNAQRPTHAHMYT